MVLKINLPSVWGTKAESSALLRYLRYLWIMTIFHFATFSGAMAVFKAASLTSRLSPRLQCSGLVLAFAIFALTSGAIPASAETRPPVLNRASAPFSQETVIQTAKALASRPYEEPAPVENSPAQALASSYDEFRMARFRATAAVQLDSLGKYRLHLLPTAWIHSNEVALAIVEDGVAHSLRADPDMFDWGPLKKVAAFSKNVPLSGFRINGPLNNAEISDEIIVFQGASYFRALSRGQDYGISARGLGLSTGAIGGEEFPRFSKFWIERPAPKVDELVIHALLESTSLTGAYMFKVRPGAETAIDVKATIFPRTEITEIGIAPLTSMYLVSSSDRTRVSDFRPSVHDSDGLSIQNGQGEHLWRALSNPRHIETSTFEDDNPKGFGLEQRERGFAAYQDMEARYHKRPSVWVEPKSGWGQGSVILVELPTENEANDNIVAFWRPKHPLQPGRGHEFSYRLSWPDSFSRIGPKARVVRTMAGRSIGPERDAGAVQFVLEYDGAETIGGSAALIPSVEASQGRLGEAQVQLNKESGTLRIAFKFYPGTSDTADLRLSVAGLPGGAETWLYRWTKGMHQ